MPALRREQALVLESQGSLLLARDKKTPKNLSLAQHSLSDAGMSCLMNIPSPITPDLAFLWFYLVP